MKEIGSQHLLVKKQKQTYYYLRSVWGTVLRDCVLLALGSFLLCGAKLRGQELPLAACLVAAVPLGLRSVSAAIGAVAGYLTFCDGTSCATLLALSVLMLAASAVFQGTNLTIRPWFMPCLTAFVCALLKGIELFSSSGQWGDWLLHWTAGGLFCAVFRSATAGDRKAKLAALAAVICGLSSIPISLNIGLFFAAALCVATESLTIPIILGLAIDLTGLRGSCNTIALALPALSCRPLVKKAKHYYAIVFLVLSNLVFLLFDKASAENVLALAVGTAAGLLLGKSRLFTQERTATEEHGGTMKLKTAAQVMELLRDQLPKNTTPACVWEAESVYDGAAEQVCRCCARFHRCWQNRAEETYAALSGAARKIIERGVAQAEDFPESFRNRCCHVEGFVTAVNQELEGMLFRRRYRMQLQESRQVVAQQMECLGEFFQNLEEESPPSRKAQTAYLPRVGICGMGKQGSRVSGDKGACFSGREGEYFILLCDGMGTGHPADRMSSETVSLLEQLLKSGLKPESALKLLNGVELLRGDDRYTTVDLLHLNLHSGEGHLYKWGAAVSYFRKDDSIEKIGTASPPPGVGVGGEYTPERYELSLKEGEFLVLVSDGADGEKTETAISAYCGESPRELAALLVAEQSGEDDMTAIVVSLQLYASG